MTTYPNPGYVADVTLGVRLEATWGDAVRDRVVHTFANAAARDAALTGTAKHEGQVVYLADIKRLFVWDGALWQYVTGGLKYQGAGGPLTYSSMSWGVLTGSPTFTVTAGPSGNILVALGALITPYTGAAGQWAALAVQVGSGGPNNPQILVSAAPGSAGVPESAYAETTLPGITPGSTYTLTVMAQASSAAVASFSMVTLRATPV